MKNSKLTFALMAGLPGTGKSTLAKELSRDLRWYVIDKDRYKARLRRRGMDNESASKKAYEKSFSIASYLLTKRRASVILDSAALHSFILENAIDIVRNLENVQLKVILCIASPGLRNERVQNRSSRFSYIKVDPATKADYSHLPSDTLTIYTNNPLEECLTIARDYLTS